MQPIPSGSAYFLSGKLIVDGGQLRIGAGTSTNVNVPDSLITKNGGTLKMIDALSTISLAGNAVFAGGSTAGLLTAGTISMAKNFSQVGSLASYAPSGTHTTTLTGAVGSTQTITFATPASNFFQNLTASTASTVALASNVNVIGTLGHAPIGSTITSVATTRLLTAGGLSNTGTGNLTFSNTQLKFVDGPGATNFANVTFSGFPASSSLTFFEIARTTGGSFTFSSPFTFSGTLSATGRYAVNSGNAAVTFSSVTPSSTAAPTACGCVTFKAVTGTGTLIWP
jgi:hypothetical protein